MTIANPPALAVGGSAIGWRGRMVAYWVATVFIAGTSAVAGAMDILRIQPLFGILLHLGFPAYFSTILGLWKILGALALIAPRLPRVKEWAYAGFFFDFSSATASHLVVGDGASALVGPVMSIVLLFVSWALRPLSRKLAASVAEGNGR